MSERKAGWYWVKLDGEWYASQYRPGYIRGGDGAEAPWSFGILLSLEEIQFEEIGPRIPSPDERDMLREALDDLINRPFKAGTRPGDAQRDKARAALKECSNDQSRATGEQ